ncbi:Uncharacterised protein [Mycobacteroides abscessus subsp. abscessus]|nr:Uncharacterised protein [Mycobacteroides abscessus subsp. abscessus]
MHHYACVSAVLVAAFALAAPARGERPGDDGFGVGYGYGWR